MKIRADKYIRREIAIVTVGLMIFFIASSVLRMLHYDTKIAPLPMAVGTILGMICTVFYGREIELTENELIIRFGKYEKRNEWKHYRIRTIPYSIRKQMMTSYTMCTLIVKANVPVDEKSFAYRHPLLFCYLHPFSSVPVHFRPNDQEVDRTAKAVFSRNGYGAVYEVAQAEFEAYIKAYNILDQLGNK